MRATGIVIVVALVAVAGWGLARFLRSQGTASRSTTEDVAGDVAQAGPDRSRPPSPADELLEGPELGPPGPTPVWTERVPQELGESAEPAASAEALLAETSPFEPPAGWQPWSIVGRVHGVRPEAPWSTRLRLEIQSADGAVPGSSSGPGSAPEQEDPAPRRFADPAAVPASAPWEYCCDIEVSEDGRFSLSAGNGAGIGNGNEEGKGKSEQKEQEEQKEQDGQAGQEEAALAAWLGRASMLRVRADDPRYTPALEVLELDPRNSWCPRRLRLELRVHLAVGVRGSVVGPDTLPVPGARVSLFELEGEKVLPAAVASVRTDASGQYHLRAPRPSIFLVVAHRPSPPPPSSLPPPFTARASAQTTGQPAATSTPLEALMPRSARVRGAPGETSLAPVLQMERGARVSGSVRVEEIGPLAGVRVLARRRDPSGQVLKVEDAAPLRWEHERVEMELHVAWTDERGEWELRDLATGGQFDISVADLVGVSRPRSLQRARRRVRPPAESVHLLLSGSVLDLRVEDVDGAPLAADLVVRQAGGGATTESVTDRGRLALLLWPESPTSLQLRAPGHRIQELQLRSPPRGETTTRGVRMALDERTTSLRGRVQAAQGRPQQVRVQLSPAHPARAPLDQVLDLDEEGCFTLEQVPAGASLLRVESAIERGLLAVGRHGPSSRPQDDGGGAEPRGQEQAGDAGDPEPSALFHPVEVPVHVNVDRPPLEVPLTLRRAGALRVRPDPARRRTRCWLGLTPEQARWLDGVDLREVVRQRGLVFEVEAPAVLVPSLLPPGTYPIRSLAGGPTTELLIEAGKVTEWTVGQ